MRFTAILSLLLLSSAVAWNQEHDPNVNSRYTVEAVELPEKYEHRLSSDLRDQMQKLVGGKFNQELVDRITKRIKQELKYVRVAQKITKGSQEEHVKVVYEVERPKREDLVVPRLVYSSKQNFSFGTDVVVGGDTNKVRFGMVTDHDQLLERYSGIRGGYTRNFNDRVSVSFLAESYRAQWDGAVVTALERQDPGSTDRIPGLYRTRLNLQPAATFVLAAPLTLTVGVSIEQFENQFPAARTETSNAWITTLRLQRRWESPVVGIQDVEAGYYLRAATTGLSSDYDYTRHSFEGSYRWSRGRRSDTVIASFGAGILNGRAPLFDRFVLGNSTTLRGWNKYDVAPLGGSRMVRGSVEYRHSLLRVFYDTGAVWDVKSDASRGDGKVKHSVGAGLASGHSKECLTLAVAFPLREGRMEPIFLIGMNF